jgi:hypothetical protein
MPDEPTQNAASVIECGSCHGEGTVTVGGMSVNPFSGVLVSDPQDAHDERCPICGGTGEAP